MSKDKFEKGFNPKLAKSLATEAIKAEWVKDFKTAVLKWSQALYVCSVEAETVCKSRLELCRNLAKTPSLTVTFSTAKYARSLKF